MFIVLINEVLQPSVLCTISSTILRYMCKGWKACLLPEAPGRGRSPLALEFLQGSAPLSAFSFSHPGTAVAALSLCGALRYEMHGVKGS